MPPKKSQKQRREEAKKNTAAKKQLLQNPEKSDNVENNPNKSDNSTSTTTPAPQSNPARAPDQVESEKESRENTKELVKKELQKFMTEFCKTKEKSKNDNGFVTMVKRTPENKASVTDEITTKLRSIAMQPKIWMVDVVSPQIVQTTDDINLAKSTKINVELFGTSENCALLQDLLAFEKAWLEHFTLIWLNNPKSSPIK